MKTVRKGRYEGDDPKITVNEAKETKETKRERKRVRDIEDWRGVSERGETSSRIRKAIEPVPREDE